MGGRSEQRGESAVNIAHVSIILIECQGKSVEMTLGEGIESGTLAENATRKTKIGGPGELT